MLGFQLGKETNSDFDFDADNEVFYYGPNEVPGDDGEMSGENEEIFGAGEVEMDDEAEDENEDEDEDEDDESDDEDDF